MLNLTRACFALTLAAGAAVVAEIPDANAGANAAVCALGYGKADGYNCDYATYDQCRASISGTSATCTDNPYFRAAQNQQIKPRDRQR